MAIMPGVPGGGEQVTQGVQSAAEGLSEQVREAKESVETAVENLTEPAKEVKEAAESAKEAAESAVKEVSEQVKEAKEAVEGAIDAVSGLGSEIASAVMAAIGPLTKATIKNLDTGVTIPCMFSPKEYSFTKTNRWSSNTAQGQNVPDCIFSGGQAMTLTMELFFDTYEKKKDVRSLTNEIFKLMRINPDAMDKNFQSRPYLCEFQWGYTWSFVAVVTSITQKFTMFLTDGTPVRSTMNVVFQQVSDEGKYPGQNPTTMSAPGYKTRRVKQGDTLDWIAHEEYGDSSLWRFLADINDLEDPLKLTVGRALAIPPKP